MKITDFFPSPSTSKKADKTDTTNTAAKKHKGQSMSQSGKTACTTIQTPKKRRERFIDPEVHVLVDTVLANVEKLFGPKPINISGKAAIWDTVVHKVNQVCGMKRTVVECKKRWSDYKRKVKQTTDKLKMQCPGMTEDILDNLTNRQKKVALFFKMNEENTNESKLTDDDSSTDEYDLGPSGRNVMTPLINNLSSEDEFIDMNTKPSSSACSIKNSPQDESISQSIEEPQAVKQSSKANKAKIPEGSKDSKPNKTQQQLTNLEAKLEQLIAQQTNTNELLQSIQTSVTASLDLQKKTSHLLKSNFLELQKSILSSKTTSSADSNILDLTLKSLRSKLDEISDSLHAKQLQELMSSDESEGNLGITQNLGARPMEATGMTTTPKRPLNRSPSSAGLSKKKKII